MVQLFDHGSFAAAPVNKEPLKNVVIKSPRLSVAKLKIKVLPPKSKISAKIIKKI